MIEVYVALTLLGIGYMINQNKPKIIPVDTSKPVAPNLKPSMQTIYNSHMFNIAQKLEAKAVKKHNKGVTESVVRFESQSELTGKPMDMRHSNMMPFYRGDIKQSMNPNANANILEAYGTKNDITFRKKEVAGMFIPEANVNKFDPATLNNLTNRVSKPVVRNNILPFKQVKVGRGIGQGFEDKPHGGFHQTDIVDLIMPKTVDELRVANNPKLSGTPGYTAPSKQMVQNRGIAGKMVKQRPETVFTMGQDRLMTTVGAQIKEKQQPNIDAKDTSRQDVREYTGSAHVNRGDSHRSDVRTPNRNDVLAGFTAANVRGTTENTGDFGKGSVQVYTNGRDITTTQTYKGNVQSLIKAIVAPVADIFKTSKKEWFIDPAREFGELNAQIPSKITVRDPNDITRTTIKETLIHDTENLNVRGPTKLTVYDPADVARTTTRQTTLQQTELLNMATHTYKNSVFDPNDVTRTTIKETLLQDVDLTNFKSAQVKGTMYDPDNKTRSTVRETLDLAPTTLNMSTKDVVNKGPSYDPDDIPRTTVKETVLGEGSMGIAGFSGVGSYVDADFEMDFKNTQKETYTDIDYYGGAQIGLGGEGYKDQDSTFDLQLTMKETNGDYFGVAGAEGFFVPMVNDGDQTKVRIPTLVERDPTSESAKSATGLEGINMEIKKTPLPNHSNDQRSHIVPSKKNVNEGEFTKTRQCFKDDNRLDMEILEPFKSNPFTKSLHSFA